jgi:hypothetical protein
MRPALNRVCDRIAALNPCLQYPLKLSAQTGPLFMHDQAGGREVSPRNGFAGHLVADTRVNELRAIE